MFRKYNNACPVIFASNPVDSRAAQMNPMHIMQRYAFYSRLDNVLRIPDLLDRKPFVSSFDKERKRFEVQRILAKKRLLETALDWARVCCCVNEEAQYPGLLLCGPGLSLRGAVY
jgi:hypothetical protein